MAHMQAVTTQAAKFRNYKFPPQVPTKGATDEQNADRDFVLDAVRQHPDSLGHAAAELQADREVGP